MSLRETIMIIPEWEGLARLGRSRLVSLTIFVPVIDYMIIFNDYIIGVLELSKEIFPEDFSNTSDNQRQWFTNIERLYLLYYGLMFLGSSSIIYQISCPPLIREYGTSRNYINEELNMMTFRRVNSILSCMQERIPKNYEKYEEISETSKDLKFYKKHPEQCEEGAHDKVITQIMLHQWEYENIVRLLSRIPIAVLYTVGFILLAIPSIELFIRVTTVVMK